MIRSNIGNSITNAFQTASVATTTFSRLSLDQADKALNAENKVKKNMLLDNKLRQSKLKTESMELKNQQQAEQIKTIDELLEDNSPQIDNIKTKMSNDIDWQEKYSKLKTGIEDIITKYVSNRDKNKGE